MRLLAFFLCGIFAHCLMGYSQSSEPLVYFKQDFCDPNLVFESATPNSGQVDHMITSSSAQSILGACYLETSRSEPTGGGSVRIIRTTPLATPVPESLHCVIELEADDISQEGNIAAYFGIGEELPTNSILIANALLFSKLSIDFREDGLYNFRVSGSSGAILSDPLSGKVTVTWVLNASNSPIQYFTPLKNQKSLEPGKYEIWINDLLWISDANRISDVALNNFAFILSNGVGKVRIHHIEISKNGFQLPLILTRFKAERRLSESLIYWEMAEGHTATFFQLERSLDSRYFEPIASLNVTRKERHQRHFSLVDPNPQKGINYYRLKMTSLEGEMKYSPVASVHFDPGEPVITIAPNPSLPDKITLLAEGVDPGSLKLYNGIGTSVLINESYDPSTRILTLLPVQPLTSGVYFLKLQKERVLKTVKVIIP